VTATPQEFKQRIAYVLQDDILFPFETVYHTLYLTARLRQPADLTDEQIKQRVMSILDALNLTDAKDTIIGPSFYFYFYF